VSEVNNRREHTRYDVNQLSVSAKSILSNDIGWLEGNINCVDFNRHGLALEADFPLLAGDTLEMVIGNDANGAFDIAGIIRNRRKMNKGYRYGIEFDYNAADKQSDVAHELLMLELHAVANGG
jgi:hypothetical protein